MVECESKLGHQKKIELHAQNLSVVLNQHKYYSWGGLGGTYMMFNDLNGVFTLTMNVIFI